MEISSHNPTGDGGGPRDARSLRDLDHVANYRIIEEIGRGGQGIVFLAEDLRNQKRVALKVLRDRGAISPESLERLRREVEAVARLHHPCICGVHEAVLDGPNPFIAMNYVAGRTLAKAIETEQRGDDKTLVIRRDGSGSGEGSPSDHLMRKGPSNRQDILRLVGVIEKVARALHVAHEARVIHRDIKPANIMLTSAGEPVILDFGLAHFEESGLEKLTKAGEIWGTVEYLSPEQLGGHRMKVDRRTDIWSLGVTLYECLTLRRPFEGPTSNQIFHSIQSRDPPDPCRVNPALPVDVRVVIETALEKDRDRRYETAQAFADDLKALVEGRQIAARPVGRITRLTRWAKRNPGVAASLLVTFGVLVTGIVVAAVLLLALNKQLTKTNQALRRVDEESDKKDRALAQSMGLRLLAESSAILPRDPALALLLAREGGSLTRDRLALTNGALNDALADLRERETLLGHLRPVETAEFSPDGARVVTTTAGGEIRVWDVKTGGTVATLSHPRVVLATFTPSGGFLVAFSSRGAARIWDARSWEEVARFGDRDASDGNGGATTTRRADSAAERLRDNLPGVLAVGLSADASRVLTVRGREATVWNPETGAKVSSLAKPVGDDASISFSLDASRILTVADGVATVWDTSSGREIATAPEPIRAGRATRLSPDGTRVVALSPDRGHVWSLKNGRVLDLKETAVSVYAVQFSPDGNRLVVITRNGIRAWDLESEISKEICGPDATQSATSDPNADLSRPVATFTRDGRLVSASCHGTAHVWNPDTGQQSATLSGPVGDVRFIAVSPQGDFVLTAASTGTATLWDTVNWIPIPLRGHSGEITHASFSADGSFVVTASSDRTARIWHTRNCPGAPILEGHQGAIAEIAFSPDGQLMLTASSDGMPRLWRVEDATLVRAFSAKKKVLSQPQLSPDGSRVLARSDEGSAVVLSVGSGDLTATIRGDLDASEFTQAAFSPDGRLILTASDEGIVYVWDAATGAEKSRYAGHRGTVNSAAFCGGGARIVSAASDRTVCFWNPEDGKEVAIHQGHADQPPVVGPRGDRVAVVAPDGAIRIWDGRTGQAVSTLAGKHAAPRFSPDGARIVTQSPQSTFKIWDVASGAEIASFPRDEGDFVQGFSPDGTTILTSTKDGAASFWDAATGSRKHSIRGHGAPVTSAGYSPDGRFVVVFWWDETRVFDPVNGEELWTAPRRHGSIRVVRFSPDSRWLAVGHAGGAVRLWPSDPIAKARAIQPRELTLQELDAHEIENEGERDKLRMLFNEDMTNEDLVTTLERRNGLTDRLRSAAITAARGRDPREVARRLCRKAWNDVLAPYGAPDHYVMALRRAEIALGLDPGVELGKTTLGAAQYRAGLAGAALATLEQAAKDAPHASTSIFIGMAHAKLGQLPEAGTALANARRLLASSGNYPDEIRRLLIEAESLCRAESRPG